MAKKKTPIQKLAEVIKEIGYEKTAEYFVLLTEVNKPAPAAKAKKERQPKVQDMKATA